jgi:hypothetical protein
MGKEHPQSSLGRDAARFSKSRGSEVAGRRRRSGMLVWIGQWSPGSTQPRLVGADHDVHAVAQAELAQDARDVALDGRLGDDQLAAISEFESPRATSLVTVSSRSLSSSARRACRPANCTHSFSANCTHSFSANCRPFLFLGLTLPISRVRMGTSFEPRTV